MDKKGVFAFDVVMWIPKLIAMLIVVVGILFLISMFTNFQFDFRSAEADIIMNSFVTSPGGVGYLDPITGRMYNEIVDRANFKSERLDSSLYIVDNNIRAAKLSLKDQDGALVDEVLYNEEWYKRWAPIAHSRLKGAGSIEVYSRRFPVVIKDGDSELGGFLDIEVFIPKG